MTTSSPRSGKPSGRSRWPPRRRTTGTGYGPVSSSSCAACGRPTGRRLARWPSVSASPPRPPPTRHRPGTARRRPPPGHHLGLPASLPDLRTRQPRRPRPRRPRRRRTQDPDRSPADDPHQPALASGGSLPPDRNEHTSERAGRLATHHHGECLVRAGHHVDGRRHAATALQAVPTDRRPTIRTRDRRQSMASRSGVRADPARCPRFPRRHRRRGTLTLTGRPNA